MYIMDQNANDTCLDKVNMTVHGDEINNKSNCVLADPTYGSMEVPSYHLSSQITATIFFVIIFVIGVLGNLLVIVVVCLHRNMKTSVNIYLINLCIADILVLTVCMPTVLVDVYSRDVWYFGKTMCLLVPFLENTVVHASVLTLIAIGIERYRVVNKPLLGIEDNVMKSIKVVPVIWIICGISNIPWFLIADYKDSRHFDGTPIKVCRLPMTIGWRKVYVTFASLLYFMIPFVILLLLYYRICFILHVTKNDANHCELKNSSQSRHRRRLRAQVINIIISLVLLFFIFHLPYRIVSIWFIYADKYEIHNLGIHKYFDILYSVRILFYLNHAINPILYNFVSSKFRNALRYLLTKREYRGSLLLSSNRRGLLDNQVAKPKQSQTIFMDNDYENKGRASDSTNSSSRQKINEFYPMYANIIQNHEVKHEIVQSKEEGEGDNDTTTVK